MCMVCVVAYPNEIIGIDLLAEIEECLSLIHMSAETPIDVLMFIVSYGDNVFPNMCAVLQILITVGVGYQFRAVNFHSQNSY